VALFGAAVASRGEETIGTPGFAVTAGVSSDYVDDGITQSAHRPSVNASVDVQQWWFYVSAQVSSVKLPTNPGSELIASAGIRPPIDNRLELDLGVQRNLYPGATPIDASGSGAYTEFVGSMTYHPSDEIALESEVAYTTNYGNMGARSLRLSEIATIKLSEIIRLEGWQVTGELGQLQFGTVSSALGGHKLPNYTYWEVGLGYAYEHLALKFNYTNTTLSRENCFVLTSDLTATPGGAMTGANPAGLRSAWCGPAWVAKLSFDMSSDRR
jgi:uncharacterized protein (TIGR02001 family)